MTEQDKKLLSTYSHDDLVDIINNESPKALYWIKKKTGGDKGEAVIAETLRKEIEDGAALASSHSYEYQGKDFTWACVFHVKKVISAVGESKDLFMKYGTDNDKGVIDIFNQRVIIYTSQFFANLGKKRGITDREEIIKYFYADTLLRQWPDDDDTDVACVCDKYILQGHISEGRTVVTDVITWSEYREYFNTDPERYRRISDLVSEYRRALDYLYRQMTHPDILEPVGLKHYLQDCDGIYKQSHLCVGDDGCNHDMFVNYGSFIIDLAKSYDPDIDPLFSEACFIKVINAFVNDDIRNNMTVEDIEERLVAATADIVFPDATWQLTILRDLIKVSPIWMAYKVLNERKLSKNYMTMDKKMKETLRRIMKRHGLRDKYENLIKAAHTTVESYLGYVENIYAVSRLHSFITNDKDRPKFLAADKEWVEYVIRENRCSAIESYVTRHTLPVVIQAVHYLMDNALWEAPLGIENIRKANADLYKGLTAIDEAVEYLRSEDKIVTPQPQNPSPATPPIEFIDDPATGKRTDAQRAFDVCRNAFQQLNDNFALLSQYFDHDELTDLLEQENTKLTKENARLTESIKTVNHQLSDAKRETERQKEIAHTATTERNRHIDNFNKLKAQYDEMREDYEALKREAQKSRDIPKVKIIPQSKILDIPLVGNGVLKGLVPFLKSYNVIIDETR